MTVSKHKQSYYYISTVNNSAPETNLKKTSNNSIFMRKMALKVFYLINTFKYKSHLKKCEL